VIAGQAENIFHACNLERFTDRLASGHSSHDCSSSLMVLAKPAIDSAGGQSGKG
jgi:hypothetical protein